MLAVINPELAGGGFGLPETPQEFDQLITQSVEEGQRVGTSEHDISATMKLFADLREFHAPTAAESLVVASFALLVGEILDTHYQGTAHINRPAIWMVGLLHDIGKTGFPELTQKSERGEQWTPQDVEHMKEHSHLGGAIIRSARLPETVARAVEENHSRQPCGNNYGVDEKLNNEERITRDSVYAADYWLAMLLRTNTRNRGLPAQDRLAACYNMTRFLFNDYSDGTRLADRVNEQATHLLVPVDQLVRA